MQVIVFINIEKIQKDKKVKKSKKIQINYYACFILVKSLISLFIVIRSSTFKS